MAGYLEEKSTPKIIDGFSVLGLLLFIKKLPKVNLLANPTNVLRWININKKNMMQAHISL
jgi:hypothetical protein